MKTLKFGMGRKVRDPTVCSHVGTARHQDGLQECTVYGGLETTLKKNKSVPNIFPLN